MEVVKSTYPNYMERLQAEGESFAREVAKLGVEVTINDLTYNPDGSTYSALAADYFPEEDDDEDDDY